MAKPTRDQIRAADPLALRAVRDPVACCNVCARPSDQLGAWQAHDDRDNPMPPPYSLVFVGKDHAACLKALDRHPRLYAEVRGDPGTFPLLCGPCRHRDSLACRHPDLKATGGPGLSVTLDRIPAILCGRGGCRVATQTAVACAGRTPATT